MSERVGHSNYLNVFIDNLKAEKGKQKEKKYLKGGPQAVLWTGILSDLINVLCVREVKFRKSSCRLAAVGRDI